MTARLAPAAGRLTPVTAGGRRPRRLAAFLGALAATGCGLALSACGIPTEATAHAIAATAHVNAAPVTTTSVAATRAGTVRITVFFIAAHAYLVPEARYVKPPASVTTAIDALLVGPTTHELDTTGITTAFPRGTGIKLIHANRVGDVTTLDFNATFGSVSGSQEVLGVAQVVFTVAEDLQPTVGVIFEIDGSPIPVPVASGELVSSPVHQSNYATLVPPGTATTTAAP